MLTGKYIKFLIYMKISFNYKSYIYFNYAIISLTLMSSRQFFFNDIFFLSGPNVYRIGQTTENEIIKICKF